MPPKNQSTTARPKPRPRFKPVPKAPEVPEASSTTSANALGPSPSEEINPASQEDPVHDSIRDPSNNDVDMTDASMPSDMPVDQEPQNSNSQSMPFSLDSNMRSPSPTGQPLDSNGSPSTTPPRGVVLMIPLDKYPNYDPAIHGHILVHATPSQSKSRAGSPSSQWRRASTPQIKV
ncbi:hypothetical protein HWV62_36903, partial [Athelia sp. TMB]